jgi:hypothetical protein
MGVKFPPSVKGIIIEGTITLDFVDGTWWSQSLILWTLWDAVSYEKYTFRWTEHVPFLGIKISVPYTQLSPTGKAIISRVDINHIFNLKTRNAPLPKVQRFDF